MLKDAMPMLGSLQFSERYQLNENALTMLVVVFIEVSLR